MSAVWIVVACGLVLAAAGVWAVWSLMTEAPARPVQEDAPEPDSADQSFPRTGAHWLDGYVIFGNTYN
ncbi:hypothetical protein SAMN04487914_10850 [Arthrobacter sp. ok909]|uniref:hypothetical protein n=1 Tax=Arthrobacter sp. ok909 TaxID=1761746 RepID=UPI0008870035|nr:hypothetical protein [Arthrobacter sp. ok909]SDP32506.1 hypothetical protein SAMN04487914_10850 [Arthrobacter sp. ok909]